MSDNMNMHDSMHLHGGIVSAISNNSEAFDALTTAEEEYAVYDRSHIQEEIEILFERERELTRELERVKRDLKKLGKVRHLFFMLSLDEQREDHTTDDLRAMLEEERKRLDELLNELKPNVSS